jgi:hypothetical protein
MTRAAKIISRAIEIGSPTTKLTAEQLVSTLARSVGKSFAGQKQVQLGHILSHSYDDQDLSLYLKTILAAEPKNLIGSTIWHHFSSEFERYTGTQPTVLESRDQDESLWMQLLSDIEMVDEILALNNQTETLVLSEDFFEMRNIITAKSEALTSNHNTLVLITDDGMGSRQGLLSLVSSSKGRIRLFGRSLSEQATRSCKLVASLLPQDLWVILSATDCLLLGSKSEIEAIGSNMLEHSLVYLFAPDQEGEESGTPGIYNEISNVATVAAAKLATHWLIGTHVRKFTDGALSVRERFRTLVAGGDDVPSIRCIPNDRIPSLYAQYPTSSYGRNTHKGEFFWYRRPSTAMRATFDQWMLMWDKKSGMFETDWAEYYHKEHRWIGEWRPLYYNGPWLNANTPVDIHALAKATVLENAPLWKAKVRKAFNIPMNSILFESEIQATQIKAPHNNFLIWRSRIDLPKGSNLVIEPGVVICGSYLDLSAEHTTDIVIPAGTVIINSHISGVFQGDGQPGGLVYQVFSNQGLKFLENQVQSTLYLQNGQGIRAAHPIDYNPSSINPRTGQKRLYDPIVQNLTHADLLEKELIDHDVIEDKLDHLQKMLP